MKTYIAILRGINVGGNRIIRMEDLKNHLKDINFKAVSTYIQSGNIIFKYPETDRLVLSKLIADKIKMVYDFDVPVIVLTGDELSDITKNNPFINNRNENGYNLYVTFLANEPDATKLKELITVADLPNEIIAGSKVLYLYCPNGYCSLKINNYYIESKLGITASSRNWNTVDHLFGVLGKKPYMMKF